MNADNFAKADIKIQYIGQTWQGSSARSLREALAGSSGVLVDEIGEDHYTPRHRMKVLRGVHRLLGPLYSADLRREIESRCTAYQPDVLMVYKGASVGPDVVDWARGRGILTVNVFPDYSPHAYGSRLRAAMGRYDLVVSTKPFHPAGWASIYGYHNRCVCVPHGYDSTVHFWPDAPGAQDIDVVLAASWRPQYESLIRDLATALGGATVSVALAGHGWAERRALFPADWQFPGAPYGRSYCQFLRRGRIAIAPVHREVIIGGVRQPGDEDSTRTYELAAAGCFFMHRRTPFVQTVYDEEREVPMWDDASELAELILQYLPLEAERREMAARAHARAVPAYSVSARAAEVLTHVRRSLEERGVDSHA